MHGMRFIALQNPSKASFATTASHARPVITEISTGYYVITRPVITVITRLVISEITAAVITEITTVVRTGVITVMTQSFFWNVSSESLRFIAFSLVVPTKLLPRVRTLAPHHFYRQLHPHSVHPESSLAWRPPPVHPLYNPIRKLPDKNIQKMTGRAMTCTHAACRVWRV